MQVHHLVPEGSGRNLGHIAGLGLSVALESVGPNSRHDSSTENAYRSPTLLIEANAVRSRVFIERNFNSTDCKGSKGAVCRALSTNAKSQEGREGAPSTFPTNLPSTGAMVSRNSSNINLKGGGGQPTLQPLLQKGKLGSDRTSPGVLTVRGTGTTHGVSTSLDAGTRGCPISEKQILPQRNRPGRGCREEHEFREPGPSGPIWSH